MQAPKGTKDMLPQDAYKWHFVEKTFRDVSKYYGMREIRTPMFEHTELFARGVGDTTDIVQKEMYTFNDKGNRSITLKPEGTAGAGRAFIESRLFNEAQPTKLYYITPCFRYENVQKGRFRQFHQFGTEVYGSKEPSMDAEVITLAIQVLKTLGLQSLSLNINNLGCSKCRPNYNEALKNYLKEKLDIVIKSDDAVQQVKEVINYYNYFTSDEKIQFQQKLRTTYLYSAAKKQKLLADMYLKHQLYVRALIAYQKLETVSGKLNAAEQIQVLYHMGLCQSRMFCFEEAKESFAMALRIKEDKQIQEAYFTAAYLAGDEEAFLEAGRKISFDEDQCKMIYQNIKEREKEVFQKEEFDKLGKIDYHRKKADENITRRLIKTTLGKWKDEYKAQTI